MYRKYNIHFVFIFSIIDKSLGIIYQLNDTEYKQLPILYELEDYDSCMQDPAAIYCVASLQLNGEPDNKIYNLIQEYSQHSIKHYNYSVIDRGVCVTKTCANYIKNKTLNDQNLEIFLQDYLNGKIKEKHNLSAKIFRLNCDRHAEDDEKDSLDYIVAIIIVLLCAAVIVGSYYDMKYGKNKGDKIVKGVQFLQCFSIARNIKVLILEDNVHVNDLKGFHGIRAIASLIVVYAHSFLMLCLFISDAHTFEKAYEKPFFRLSFSTSSTVQIFFIMSGFLLTYLHEISAENREVTWRSVFMELFKRWLRLVTSMAFVIAIVATWFRYLGSGPLWKYYVTNFAKPQSRQYFWAHLCLLNNFFKDDRFYYQTWHLAADMQLYVPCLIIYFAIRNRSLKFKIGTLSFLMVIGVVSPILHVWLQDLHCAFMLTPEMYRTVTDETFNKYYVLPHNNIAGFVSGMVIGYLGYYLKQKKLELPNFKLGNILCWLAIPMYIGTLYVPGLAFIHPERPSLTFRILYAASHRIVSGLIGAVWILGNILKFNDCSKTLMEWHWWVVLSKLSYGVYLIHSVVINYLLGMRKQVLYYSFPNVYFIYIGVVVVSNALALVLYLLVEAPSNQLIKLFISDKTSSKNKEKKLKLV